MKSEKVKIYVYTLLILTIIFYFSCSSSSFDQIKRKGHYHIYNSGTSLFIDYDIIFAKDYNGKDIYILTKILKDSLISSEYEKVSIDSVYKLKLENIDSIVVIEINYDWNSLYIDEKLIWSEDTVRVPLYSVENIVKIKDNVYIKKRE